MTVHDFPSWSSAFVAKKPIPTINNEPMTCRQMSSRPAAYSFRLTRNRTSAEKAENVVKLPKNPVVSPISMSRLIRSSSRANHIRQPVIKQPDRLAMRVPKGMEEMMGLYLIANVHLSKAPPLAPMMMKSTCFTAALYQR